MSVLDKIKTKPERTKTSFEIDKMIDDEIRALAAQHELKVSAVYRLVVAEGLEKLKKEDSSDDID